MRLTYEDRFSLTISAPVKYENHSSVLSRLALVHGMAKVDVLHSGDETEFRLTRKSRSHWDRIIPVVREILDGSPASPHRQQRSIPRL